MTPRVSKRLPWWRVVLIILLTIALGWVAAQAIIKPIQKTLANRYLARGDSYFISLDYSDAISQYTTALHYNPNLTAATTNRELAKEAVTDPAAAQSFFNQHNVTTALEVLNEAEQSFTNPKDALTEGVKLYTDAEYSYAQYPLQKAVQLDPGYPEAWHYLALTYQALAKLNPSFNAKATAALTQQNMLTSKYLTPQ